MSYYRICRHCGAHLDPGEVCDCAGSMYSRLTEENKRKFNEVIDRMIEEQKTAPSAANTEDGGVDTSDQTDSTSNDTTN